MATTIGLDPQTAGVLADPEDPGVPRIADMTPDEARARRLRVRRPLTADR